MLIIMINATSCGTITRNESSAQVYPALDADCEMYSMFSGCFVETWEPGPDQSVGQFFAMCGFLGTTIDVPISLVTDTILFPYDLWWRKIKKETPNKGTAPDAVPSPES